MRLMTITMYGNKCADYNFYCYGSSSINFGKILYSCSSIDVHVRMYAVFLLSFNIPLWHLRSKGFTSVYVIYVTWAGGICLICMRETKGVQRLRASADISGKSQQHVLHMLCRVCNVKNRPSRINLPISLTY